MPIIFLIPVLSLIDTVAVIVGIVVGAGIFKLPSLVAANVGSGSDFLLLWCLGGLISLVGALCYAELATTHPHAGGEYHYLSCAFGREVGFLFAWARLSVMQTGSLALLAFLVGDYLSELLPLGNYSASVYAALVTICLTGFNVLGIELGKWVQNFLTLAKLLGLLFVVFTGLILTPPPSLPVAPPIDNSDKSYGLAMIFVLLTYGGWSEAAYLSAELRDVKRDMKKALLGSISLIAALFLLLNFAYLQGLGLAGIAQSEVVAADLMRRTLGEGGAQFISFLISLAALGSINGTMITGARTNYALGQEVKLFGLLGSWNQETNTPQNAFLVQGMITLALVLLGTLTRRGFTTMVDYTAPVFWFFLLLVGLSLFILRAREPDLERPFCVPLYPLTPVLFCGTCVYLLGASLIYTGVGALVGIAVLLVGIPLWLVVRLEGSRKEGSC
jgi:amino acid transporter